MAKKNNLLEIMGGSGSGGNSAKPDNNLLDILKGNKTQSSQAASTSIGRSIDSQQAAWDQALKEKPSTWNPEPIEAPKTTPLLSFTPEWQEQQAAKKAEEEKPKKKSWFASLIENANKKSEENPWDYDATNNIIDTSVPATPKEEKPKKVEPPKEEKKKEEPVNPFYTDLMRSIDDAAKENTADYGLGNIDLNSRPRFQNPDGTISTVDSTSFNVDGKEVLIPTVIQEDGEWKHVSPEEALEHYRKTGEYLGKFDTPEEADAYAQQLHEDQERLYVDNNGNPFSGILNWGKNVFKAAAEGTAASLTGAQRALYEAGQKSRTAQYQEEIEQLQRDLDRAKRSYEYDKEDGMSEADLQSDLYIIEDIQRKLDAYNKVVNENVQEEATKATSELSNQLQEESAKYTEYAKAAAGDNWLGNFATDISVNALQMAGDAAMNLIAPGTSLATMGLRTFGSSAQEAEAEGATLAQQLGYGAVKGGIEVATEMMFDGLAGLYGKGGADEIVEEVIRKLTAKGDDATRTVLRVMFGGIGEAVEEGVSGAADPLAKSIYKGIASIPESYNKEQASEVLYDMLVGFAMGGGFSTVGIATGNNAEANAELRETDAIQAELEASGIDEGTAEQAAPIIKKANAGEELTKREKNILLEIMMRDDAAAGSAETVSTAESAEAQEEVSPTIPQHEPQEATGTNPAKAAQLETSLDTAQENQIAPATETTQTTQTTQTNEISPNKAAQIETELDNAEQNQPAQQESAPAAEKAATHAPASPTPGEMSASKAAQTQTAFDKRTEAGAKRPQNPTPETHIDNRTPENVGSRSINAFQWDHPEIKDFFKRAAALLRRDLANSQDSHTVKKAGGGNNSRLTNPLLNKVFSMFNTTQEAIDACEAIMFDRGSENYADPKRIEIILDEMLTNGYVPRDSSLPQLAPDADYAETKGRLEGGTPYENDARARAIQNILESDFDGTMTEEDAAAEADSNYATYGYYDPMTRDGQTALAVEDTSTTTLDEIDAADTAEIEQKYSKPESAQESSENATETLEASGNAESPATAENELNSNLAETTATETNTEASTAENTANPQAEAFVPNVNQDAEGGKVRVSQTSTNTEASIAEMNGAEQAPISYLTKTEAQTLNAAMNRVDADMVGEMNNLASKEMWTDEDMDTAATILSRLRFDSVKNGDTGAADAWAKVYQEHGTAAARALQSMGKWSRTGSAAYVDIVNEINNNDSLTEEQKTQLKKDAAECSQEFDAVEDGDFEGLINLILKQSQIRKTGTFNDGNYEALLKKIKDFDWLKEYALRQMMAIPADYTNRATFAQRTKTWQVNSQLTRLGTFFRNLGGNASFGILDTFSQDAFGYAIDSLIAKKTGRKEVGFDKGWLSKAARNAAIDAANKSILEIAGDVDMGSDPSKYGTTSNRTNKMVGRTTFERFMSRWEQLLGYSLNTSDRFFRGQIEQSFSEALGEQENLSQRDREQLAQMMADYRLFQNNGLAARFSKGAHNVLNLFGYGGEVRGAERQGGFGLGDLINPYPGVPANLAVKLFEYSPANIIKGGIEIAKVLRDANSGKTVTGRQMTAAMDIARGITGVGVVALFSALAKSGLFRNSDDEEDYDVMTAQGAQGLSGVQWNLDATIRALQGGKADWKDGDNLMKISWLEPINAFMSVASMISDEEDDADLAAYAGDYMQGAVQAFLDLPVMENIQTTVNTFKYSTGDTIFERAGQGAASFLGSSLGGMIPAPISQLARTTDEYYRDTSGSTKAESAVNALLNSIPYFRNLLDVKTDNFGNAKLNEPNVLNRVLNSFVLPGTINTFMQSDVQAAVAEVYEATGKASVYPDRKGVKSLSYDSKQYDLTEEEQKKYHETAGKKSEEYISAFIKSNYYDDLTDEQRADIITALNSDAKDYAKYEYLKGQKVKADNPETKNQATLTALKTLGNKANGSFKDGRETDYETLDFIVNNIYPQLSKAEKDALNSAGSYGRYDNLYECSRAGIGSKTFEKFLNKAREIDKNSHSYSVNAEEYAAYVDKQKGLTTSQRKALKNIYKYTTTLVADTKTYDKWVSAGLSYDDAVGFNKKIDTNGNNSKSNTEIYAAIEQYATDAEMAEKLWEAANSATWSKSGKSYFQANPNSKFRSSWSGKTYSTPSSASKKSSDSSSSSNNELLAILNGSAFGNGTSTQTGSSTSASKDRNELLKILGAG